MQTKTKEQEDQVELRRLRTENRLLRQRIENLEKETGELADRLIKGQVSRAEEADITDSLKSELSRLKRMHVTAVAEMDAALLSSAALQGTVRALKEIVCFGDTEGVSPMTTESISSCGDAPASFSIPSHLSSILENPDIRLIYDEFARLKATISELRQETGEFRQQFEQQQQLLGDKTGHSVIDDRGDGNSVSSISTMEYASNQLKQDIDSLRDHFKALDGELKEIQQQNGPTNSSDVVRDLREQLAALRLKEADSCSQLIQVRHNMLDLEAQHQIERRTMTRLQERVDQSETELENARSKERSMLSKINDLERQVANLKACNADTALRNRIQAAEHSQTVAELRQKAAQLELEKEELQMTGKLLKRLDDDITQGDSMTTSKIGDSAVVDVDDDDTDEFRRSNGYYEDLSLKLSGSQEAIVVASDETEEMEACSNKSDKNPQL